MTAVRLTKGEFDAKLKEARERVEEFDKVDGIKDREIGTIIEALTAGIAVPESGAQYDALVMLMDIRKGAKSEA